VSSVGIECRASSVVVTRDRWQVCENVRFGGRCVVLRPGRSGANIGRGEQLVQTRDVQRFESAPSQTRPDYWDVTYNFQGQEHRAQMVAPPGQTITVNARGEPRA